jgi:fumarylacetoacetase
MPLDATHDPKRRSFVDVPDSSPFTIHNLPYGVFRTTDRPAPRAGIAIGEHVVDLSVLEREGLLDVDETKGRRVFGEQTLNAFLALGRPAWRAVRRRLSELLSDGEPRLRDDESLRKEAIVPMSGVEMLLPVEIGDYTDFYSSREHATNVGTMFRGKDNALMPNWLHLPVAYHGRASSVVVSGTPVRRPCGQTLPKDADRPVFGPSRLLDFELEMGFFVGGPATALGEPVSVSEAEERIFGMVLVNDWSARDVQKWEYQPLGPFNAKNFATSISPWIVTLDALEPFRAEGPKQDPEPLPYLRTEGNPSWDIDLEMLLATPEMSAPARIGLSNFRYLYWNVRQQLAHHTITGCNVRPGDMMASGTISGPDPSERGSLLELCWRGETPIELPNGETRTFLRDGDTLVLRGTCEKEGVRIGFGDVSGTILPAHEGGAR